MDKNEKEYTEAEIAGAWDALGHYPNCLQDEQLERYAAAAWDKASTEYIQAYSEELEELRKMINE